ncbi:MAG TPA: LacI family DNA-binding transcriptional regulator [Arsenophonus sp.]
MEQKITNHNPTMKDVANTAGVSTATVSRALTNPAQVSAKTRYIVEEAALETGYNVCCMTKNGRFSQPKTIFVVIPDIINPTCPDIISCIEQVAAEQGYMVLIVTASITKNHLLDIFISKQIDDIILLNSDIPFEIAKRNPKDFLLIVVANEFVPEFKLAAINYDSSSEPRY